MSGSNGSSYPAGVASGPGSSWIESYALIATLYRHARYVVRCDDLAWDAVQETLMTALRLTDGSGAPPSMPWLLRTLRHRCLHARRCETRRQDYEREAADLHESLAKAAALDALAALERRERARVIAFTLAELPVEQREALLLQAIGGHSYVTIARMQGVPIGTVRSRIARARRALEARLTTTRPTPHRRVETRRSCHA